MPCITSLSFIFHLTDAQEARTLQKAYTVESFYIKRDALEKAMNAVRSGELSVRGAANMFSVPKCK